MGLCGLRRWIVRGAGVVVVTLGITSAAGAPTHHSDVRRPLPSPRSCSVPPRYLGLDAYRHWDALSYLELGDRVSG